MRPAAPAQYHAKRCQLRAACRRSALAGPRPARVPVRRRRVDAGRKSALAEPEEQESSPASRQMRRAFAKRPVAALPSAGWPMRGFLPAGLAKSCMRRMIRPRRCRFLAAHRVPGPQASQAVLSPAARRSHARSDSRLSVPASSFPSSPRRNPEALIGRAPYRPMPLVIVESHQALRRAAFRRSRPDWLRRSYRRQCEKCAGRFRRVCYRKRDSLRWHSNRRRKRFRPGHTSGRRLGMRGHWLGVSRRHECE